MDKELQDNLERSGLGGLIENLLKQTSINANNEKRIRSLEKITGSVMNRNKLSFNSIEPKVDKEMDSGSPVVKKLYDFLVKTSEEDKKRYELEKNFEQERREESNRKYEKLLKVVSEKKKVEEKKKEKEDTKKSFFEKLFDGLLKGFGIVFKLIGKTLLGVITTGLKVIKGVLGGLGSFIATTFKVIAGKISEFISGFGFIGKMIKGIFGVIGNIFSVLNVIRTFTAIGNLTNTILKLTKTVSEIVFSLGKTITEIVFNILESSSRALFTLGSKIMKTFIVPFFEKIWINVLKPLIKAAGGALARMGTPAAILTAAGVAIGTEKATAPLQYGEKYLKLKEEYDEMKNRLPGGRKDPKYQERLAAKEKEVKDALQEHNNTVVTPAMLDAGYELVMQTTGDWGWQKPNESGTFIKMGHDEEVAKKNKQEGTKGTIEKLSDSALEYVYKNLGPEAIFDAMNSAKIRSIVGEHKIKDTISGMSSDAIEKYKQSQEYVSEMANQGKDYASDTLTKLKEQGSSALDDISNTITNKLDEHGLSIENLEDKIKNLEKSMVDLASKKYEQVTETATRVSESVSDTVETAEKAIEPVATAIGDIGETATQEFAGVNDVPSALNATGETLAKVYDRLSSMGAMDAASSKAMSFAGSISKLANMDITEGAQSFIGFLSDKVNQGVDLNDDKSFADAAQEFWGKLTASPFGSVPASSGNIIDSLQKSYTDKVPTLGNIPTPELTGVNIPPDPADSVNPLVDALDDINTPINNVYNTKTQSSGEAYLNTPPVRNPNFTLRMIDITSAVPL